MWYYRRRLSVHPIESTVTFAGQRLKIAANGCVLSPVDEVLDLKMKRAPHVFIFKAAPAAPVVETAPAVDSAPAPPAVAADEGAVEEAEKVETSSTNEDNVETKRKRRKIQG